MDTVSQPRQNASTLLIACGALAREILFLIRTNNWNHLELICLPAQLHLTPEKIPASVEQTVLRYRKQYRSIFVVYADCGTGGLLQKMCEKLGIEMIEGPHCYSFYDGNARFAQRDSETMTSFYLTDFLVRQFDAFVWKPLGLDRHPELKSTYFRHYEQLVYLAQTDDLALRALAETYAKRLELKYIWRLTGYGDLQDSLENLSL